MKTVKEVSILTGVSVRTLHHYDAMGLLKPTRVTPAGYRLYDDGALARLHTILLLRQLRFPLKEIKEILDTPGFDPIEALTQQIELLELQRRQLDGLIAHARQIQKTGVMAMNFEPFDCSELETYASQAKARWGHTDAYKESVEKTKSQTHGQLQATGRDLMDIFARMGALSSKDPASPEAQELVAELQQFITEHYYKCTREILRGLGQLYIAGDSMTENINNAGGDGTAEFAHKAIEVYCKTAR